MSVRERVLHWLLDGHVWEIDELTVYNPDDSPVYGAISCRCKVCDATKTETVEIDVRRPELMDELGEEVDRP